MLLHMSPFGLKISLDDPNAHIPPRGRDFVYQNSAGLALRTERYLLDGWMEGSVGRWMDGGRGVWIDG